MDHGSSKMTRLKKTQGTQKLEKGDYNMICHNYANAWNHMANQGQEIVEGVAVTQQPTQCVCVAAESRLVPTFRPATCQEPGITDITTHIDQRRR